MTTGSSSPRSPEYAISALDLPTGETTTATGTHQVRPPQARPDTGSPAARPSPVRPPQSEEDAEPAGEYHATEDPFEEDAFVEDAFADEPFPADPDPYDQDRGVRDEAAREYGDPVGDLVRAAVADRPLEEVVDLITMLEGSPSTHRPRSTRSVPSA